MSEELVILFPPDETALGPFARVSPRARWCRTAEDVAAIYCQRSVLRCLAFDSVELVRTVATLGRPRRHKLLLLETINEHDAAVRARLQVLWTLFAEVVRPEPSLNFLDEEDLAEVLSAPKPSELAIAASYDPAAESIYVLRGNLETLTIPAAALTNYGKGPKPDLTRLKVEDCGQSLAAGDYESSMDALLYEYDANYRRELRKKRHAEEKSLGGCLRRLRLQRGLRQSDFPEVSTKEVARIERGEVMSPHAETLEHIASRLGVSVEELAEY